MIPMPPFTSSRQSIVRYLSPQVPLVLLTAKEQAHAQKHAPNLRAVRKHGARCEDAALDAEAVADAEYGGNEPEEQRNHDQHDVQRTTCAGGGGPIQSEESDAAAQSHNYAGERQYEVHDLPQARLTARLALAFRVGVDLLQQPLGTSGTIGTSGTSERERREW